MKNAVIKIQRIRISNLKNVKNGTIKFNNYLLGEKCDDKFETIGIYGQNGSGKTALVDACRFLKNLLEGNELFKDTYDYINVFSKESTLEFDFHIERLNERYLVNYKITLKKLENKIVEISHEKLSYSKFDNGIWKSKKAIISYDKESTGIEFKPKIMLDKLISSDKENIVQIKVAKQLSIEKNTSFIFNKYSMNIFGKAFKNEEYGNIIKALQYYAKCNLIIINNKSLAAISLNLFLPLTFRLEDENEITVGDIAIPIKGVPVITEENFCMLNKVIFRLNIVLNKIIPTLRIELRNYGKQQNPDGTEGIKVQLLSLKDNLSIPIECESEGIIKIICILGALISVYNKSSVCVVIDELDSGIYEYLLGEILKVLEFGGKGQLIFTSHNLRPLEILNNESVFFTTTNPDNRYINFTNVKTNNNLRSLYIKSIVLGGQKENLYNETNDFEIRRAFRLAGEVADEC
ncbi:MAG: AAA family ATPase [Clostridia bacterium]|nr:AAA family ATPase [Clostridia bacterium]MDD4386236.1 AAA family ATPase [Clostridia bacterium]